MFSYSLLITFPLKAQRVKNLLLKFHQRGFPDLGGEGDPGAEFLKSWMVTSPQEIPGEGIQKETGRDPDTPGTSALHKVTDMIMWLIIHGNASIGW